MKNSLFILIPIFSILFACTQPKYIQKTTAPVEPTSPQTNQEKIQKIESGLFSISDNTKSQEALANICQIQLKNSHTCILLSWIKYPIDNGYGSFELKFFKYNEKTHFPEMVQITNTVLVKLWMPSMGHGSRPVKVTELENGIYSVENVSFIMPGDWDIEINILQNSQVIDEATISLTY